MNPNLSQVVRLLQQITYHTFIPGEEKMLISFQFKATTERIDLVIVKTWMDLRTEKISRPYQFYNIGIDVKLLQRTVIHSYLLFFTNILIDMKYQQFDDRSREMKKIREYLPNSLASLSLSYLYEPMLFGLLT